MRKIIDGNTVLSLDQLVLMRTKLTNQDIEYVIGHPYRGNDKVIYELGLLSGDSQLVRPVRTLLGDNASQIIFFNRDCLVCYNGVDASLSGWKKYLKNQNINPTTVKDNVKNEVSANIYKTLFKLFSAKNEDNEVTIEDCNRGLYNSLAFQLKEVEGYEKFQNLYYANHGPAEINATEIDPNQLVLMKAMFRENDCFWITDFMNFPKVLFEFGILSKNGKYVQPIRNLGCGGTFLSEDALVCFNGVDASFEGWKKYFKENNITLDNLKEKVKNDYTATNYKALLKLFNIEDEDGKVTLFSCKKAFNSSGYLLGNYKFNNNDDYKMYPQQLVLMKSNLSRKELSYKLSRELKDRTSIIVNEIGVLNETGQHETPLRCFMGDEFETVHRRYEKDALVCYNGVDATLDGWNKYLEEQNITPETLKTEENPYIVNTYKSIFALLKAKDKNDEIKVNAYRNAFAESVDNQFKANGKKQDKNFFQIFKM